MNGTNISARAAILSIVAGFLNASGERSYSSDAIPLEGTHLRKLSVWSDSTLRVSRFRYRGGLIYAVNGFKLQTIDVRDWENPALVGELELPSVNSSKAFVDVEVIGQRAYIVQAARHHGERAAKVIDISEPSSPMELSDTPMKVLALQYNGQFAAVSESLNLIILDADEVGNLSERSRISYQEMHHGVPAPEIVLGSSYAFPIHEGVPLVVDLSNPDKPAFLGRLKHHLMVPNGNILYTTGEPFINQRKRVDIWCLEDDAQQTLKSSMELIDPDTMWVSQPYLGGDVLYCIVTQRSHERILYAFDVSEIESISEIGALTFPPSGERTQWMVAADGYLMVAIDGALHLYEVLANQANNAFTTAYEAWGAGVFFDTPQAKRNASADPDRDGNANVVEMATGGNPLKADVPIRITHSAEGLQVTYNQDSVTAAFFEYLVEVSPDLSVDSWNLLQRETSFGSTAGINHITAMLPASAPFARLRILVKSHSE